MSDYNEQMPKISVIMLNYNGLGYLKRTLGPVLDLNYGNYEVIVVDNGSTDGSLEYLKTLEKVRLIESPKKGEKNFACNYAVSFATGEYILMMDNDVIIEEKELLNGLMDQWRRLGDVGQLGLCFVDEGETWSYSYGFYLNYGFASNMKSMTKPEMLKLKDQRISFADGKCFFIKKSNWLEVGGYDEHLVFGGDDNDLGIKLGMQGHSNYLYNRTIQTHIGMPERTDTTKYARKYRMTTHAHLYTILKNYTPMNAAIHFITYWIFSLLKACKQSWKRRNISTLIGWFRANFDLLGDLGYIWKMRRDIQGKRKVREDVFLAIKSPAI